MTKEEEKNSYRERYLQILSEFCLMDDSYMTLFFGGNIETTQLLLRIILEDPGITVIETVGQFEIKNPNGRSVRLDIHAVDANGQHFDVEVQRQDAGAAAERARFNSSMLDTKMANVGDKIPKLKPAYTIFITENDVLGGGCPLYHIDRKITELDDQLFGDGSHIIYVNGAYTNEDSPIGKLVHDFRCKSPDEMYYEILSDRDRYFKETEGGRDDMCKLMDDFKNEITEEVTKRVSKETAIISAVDTARLYGIAEEVIFNDIMKRFDLSESEARSYMLKKSA
ncbi:MAG: PD-(D/E)XK nuclease family transposase [Oscillospiraceae bacterium]|nr:PD-(D/E)XK nuclease family transposase [Ruminococcus sp.]MCD8346103.1 PD-(D/E)XK nuclease family transposase [Oscillospiraceae bacterium]